VKLTIEQRLCAGLRKLGLVEGKPTTHYRVFLPTDTSRVNFKTGAAKIFVGRSGALRGSRSGKVSDTFSYNDTVKERVLKTGELG
jgi:hypothetical protein